MPERWIIRAAAITGLVIALDGLVVAPVFERSYEIRREAGRLMKTGRLALRIDVIS